MIPRTMSRMDKRIAAVVVVILCVVFLAPDTCCPAYATPLPDPILVEGSPVEPTEPRALAASRVSDKALRWTDHWAQGRAV
jgi:hypothetical protein